MGILNGQSFGLQSTPWESVVDVEDADVSQSFITGIPHLDKVFGDILPGTTMSMSAKGGTGKTTLFLQIAQEMAIHNNIKVGYISSEQSVSRVKGTAIRCNVLDRRVLLKNENNIEALSDIILNDDVQLVIIDSISKLSSNIVTGAKKIQDHARNMLIGAANRSKVIVIFICHMNKDGTIKGGTDLIHDIDIELYIEKLSDNVRRLYSDKNRNGELSSCNMVMGAKGYDLFQQVTNEGKSYSDEILNYIENNVAISKNDLKILCHDSDMSYGTAIESLASLECQGKIILENDIWVPNY